MANELKNIITDLNNLNDSLNEPMYVDSHGDGYVDDTEEQISRVLDDIIHRLENLT